MPLSAMNDKKGGLPPPILWGDFDKTTRIDACVFVATKSTFACEAQKMKKSLIPMFPAILDTGAVHTAVPMDLVARRPSEMQSGKFYMGEKVHEHTTAGMKRVRDLIDSENNKLPRVNTLYLSSTELWKSDVKEFRASYPLITDLCVMSDYSGGQYAAVKIRGVNIKILDCEGDGIIINEIPVLILERGGDHILLGLSTIKRIFACLMRSSYYLSETKPHPELRHRIGRFHHNLDTISAKSKLGKFRRNGFDKIYLDELGPEGHGSVLARDGDGETDKRVDRINEEFDNPIWFDGNDSENWPEYGRKLMQPIYRKPRHHN